MPSSLLRDWVLEAGAVLRLPRTAHALDRTRATHAPRKARATRKKQQHAPSAKHTERAHGHRVRMQLSATQQTGRLGMQRRMHAPFLELLTRTCRQAQPSAATMDATRQGAARHYARSPRHIIDSREPRPDGAKSSAKYKCSAEFETAPRTPDKLPPPAPLCLSLVSATHASRIVMKEESCPPSDRWRDRCPSQAQRRARGREFDGLRSSFPPPIPPSPFPYRCIPGT